MANNGRSIAPPPGTLATYHVHGTLIARNRYPSGLVETPITVDAYVRAARNHARSAVAQVAQMVAANDDWWGYGDDVQVDEVIE